MSSARPAPRTQLPTGKRVRWSDTIVRPAKRQKEYFPPATRMRTDILPAQPKAPPASQSSLQKDMGFDLYEESEPLEEASTGQVQDATAVATDESAVGGVVSSIASIVPDALGFIGNALGIGSSQTPDDAPTVAAGEPAEEKDIKMEVEADIQMEQELRIPDMPSTDNVQPVDGVVSAQLSEDTSSTAVDESPQASDSMSAKNTDGFKDTVGSIDEPTKPDTTVGSFEEPTKSAETVTTPEWSMVTGFRNNHNKVVQREKELMEQRGEDPTAFLEEQKVLGERTITDMTNTYKEAIGRSSKDSSASQTVVAPTTSSPEEPLILRRSMSYGADNNVTRVMDKSNTLSGLKDNITKSGIKNKGRAVISAIHDTLENMGADKLSSDLQQSLMSGIASITAGTKGFKQLAKTRASDLGTVVTEWLQSNGLTVAVGGLLTGAVVMAFAGKYAKNKLRSSKFETGRRVATNGGLSRAEAESQAVKMMMSKYNYPEEKATRMASKFNEEFHKSKGVAYA